jgi:hypothetical protein
MKNNLIRRKKKLVKKLVVAIDRTAIVAMMKLV